MRVSRCLFLLIMSFTALILLLLLNIYIGYEAIINFKGDGWSFLGGLIILLSWILTIPAFIFSVLSIRMIRYDNSKKFIFPVTLSVIGILSGIILHNATELWIYIFIFSSLLLVSCLVCKNKKANSKS